MDLVKLTSYNPARLLNINKGVLEEGKDADIVIWSGHPLDIMTEASVVILNGCVEKNI